MAFKVEDQGRMSLKSKYFKGSRIPTKLHQVLIDSFSFSHRQTNRQTDTHTHTCTQIHEQTLPKNELLSLSTACAKATERLGTLHADVKV